MSKTVSIFLMGGLGNQLFQIFAVLSYCIKYGYNLVIPYLETLNTGEIRATYWNNFLTGLKQFTNYNGELSTQYLQSFPIFSSQLLFDDGRREQKLCISSRILAWLLNGDRALYITSVIPDKYYYM